MLVKIGGSITEKGTYKQIKSLGICLFDIFSKFKKFAIIPGGGIFAEEIRKMQVKEKYDDELAHWLAIDAMDLHGYFLKNFIPKSEIYEINFLKFQNSFSDFYAKNKIPILSVFEFMKKHSVLEHSWNTTSDAITIEIAAFLGIKEVLFLKDVDGIFREEKITEKISVKELSKLNNMPFDRFTPSLLERYEIRSYLINGFYPDRVFNFFKGKRNIPYTEILY